MSCALSSIVRTRQKNFFLLLIFTLLFFGPLFGPLFPPSGVQASESRLNSVASPNSVGRASSEDNIDSFAIHPANRWTETNTGFSDVTVDNGMLNMTDVGDGSNDKYVIQRDLRDLEGNVEVKFKIDSNFSTAYYKNGFTIKLVNENSEDVRLWMLSAKDASYYIGSILRYETTDAANDEVSLSAYIYDDIWYELRIDYDILESECRFRLYYENRTKVFDYDYFDVIDAGHFAEIFSSTNLELILEASSYTIAGKMEILVDYINAPFKEREWAVGDESIDADWLDQSPFMVKVQDDIADSIYYFLTVPYLDSVSGSMFIKSEDLIDPGDNADILYTEFRLYAVDYDDGDKHELLSIIIQLRSVGGGGAAGSVIVNEAQAGNITIKHVAPFIDTTQVDLDFACSLGNDRTQLTWSIAGYMNDNITNHNFLAVGEIDVTDAFADASQEFVLETAYSMTMLYNTEVFAGYKSFSMMERSWLSDLGSWIDDVISDTQQSLDPFTALFRWLGNLLATAFETIFGGFQTWISGVLTTIGTYITNIASDIWSGIGTALDFITTAIEGIVGLLVAAIDDFIGGLLLLAEDAAALLFAILAFLLVLVLDIVEAMWAVAEKTIFFIWDALGLPDVVEIFTLSLAYITEFVQWLVVTLQSVIQLFADLSWLILVGWWVWALPVQWARANGDPLAGLGNFIEVFFYDLVPWEVIGFHIYVPQGIAATLWMILLLPETYVLFTALGV